jgi:hypothetical protein
MNRSFPLAALVALVLAGCDTVGSSLSSIDGAASDSVCLWLSADKDATVSCGRTSSCEEGDRNFGQDGILVVADWENAHKQTYIRFTIPTLPVGTEIIDAYVELNHPGKNEDGKRDDIDIPFMRASGPWSPMTITWRNQPNADPLVAESTIRLRSQAWSGSPNVLHLVRPWFENPSTNHGILVYWRSTLGLGIEKGFYGNNDIRRKQNDPGPAPRLLVRIKLPEGKTTNDITLPYLAADTDLDQPRPVTTVLFRKGGTWPADWSVAPKQ